MARFDFRTINGPIYPIMQGLPGAPGFLDIYPNAQAAYSLRRINTAYMGGAIRVRRSSDNTELNIGFTNDNNLDTTALLTFVGAGSGFVTVWYDQTGNSNDQVQTTAATQPSIVTAGVLITINTKPAVFFNQQWMNTTTTVFNATRATMLVVNRMTQNGLYRMLINVGGTTSGSYTMTTGYGNNLSRVGWLSSGTVLGGQNLAVQNLMIMNNSATTGYYHYNANAPTSTNFNQLTYGNQKFYLGRDSTTSTVYWFGHIQEAIFYPSDQNANISGFKTNINSYYSIY